MESRVEEGKNKAAIGSTGSGFTFASNGMWIDSNANKIMKEAMKIVRAGMVSHEAYKKAMQMLEEVKMKLVDLKDQEKNKEPAAKKAKVSMIEGSLPITILLPKPLGPKAKAAILDGFPSTEEMKDEQNWYNKWVMSLWDENAGKQCDICGLQGHCPMKCTSPLKWRHDMDMQAHQEHVLGEPIVVEVPKDISEEAKMEVLAEFPTADEEYDEDNWYNQWITKMQPGWTDDCCRACGLFGHHESKCTSPLKWRRMREKNKDHNTQGNESRDEAGLGE